jgi:tagatose-1,6-bisphosphate aldolase
VANYDLLLICPSVSAVVETGTMGYVPGRSSRAPGISSGEKARRRMVRTEALSRPFPTAGALLLQAGRLDPERGF